MINWSWYDWSWYDYLLLLFKVNLMLSDNKNLGLLHLVYKCQNCSTLAGSATFDKHALMYTFLIDVHSTIYNIKTFCVNIYLRACGGEMNRLPYMNSYSLEKIVQVEIINCVYVFGLCFFFLSGTLVSVAPCLKSEITHNYELQRQ